MISVLYVDDELPLLEIGRLFLEESGGFRVGTATSATEALERGSITSYDAIVSDYHMPGMDGIAFLKTVRERFGDIPFILFTGRGREEVVIEAINNGADFYLQKGGDPEAQFAELAHKIRQAIRRKQTERSLQDSERRLADIIDFLPDATFAIDRTGCVIAWNRAIEEMTGIEAAEMIGNGNHAYAVPFYGKPRPMLIDLVERPDDEIRNYYTNVSRSGHSLTAETDHASMNGRHILVLAKACSLFNQDGEITGAIESIRDITEQKLAEQTLREREEMFRNLIQNSSDMVHIISREGRITYASPSARRLFGYDPARVSGEDPLVFIHPDDQGRVRAALGELLKGKNASGPMEYRVRHSDGHYIDVEAVASNQLTTPGINGIIVTTRPVTERKRGEASLRESESRFGAVFRDSPVALTLLSAAGGIFTDVNEAFVRGSGFLREDVIGKTPEEAGIFAGGHGKLTAQLQERGSVQGLELDCRRKSGEIRTCRFSAGIITMGGEPFILASVEDVTENKAAGEALQAMVRSMVGTTGLDSLNKIAENVGRWLQADCVMIGEIQQDRETVNVLSMILDGKKIGGFSYTLKGTPCEDASEKGFCIYPDNVRGAFPGAKDLADMDIRGYIGTPLRDSHNTVIGILCVLTRRPIQPSETIREIMDILAVKAAAEIERFGIETELGKSRWLLAEAMDLAHIATWEYDIGADRFIFDDRFFALYGTTAEREGGTTMSSQTYTREFVHPDDRWMVAAEIEKAMKTTDPGYTAQSEHRIIRRDGRTRDISVRIAITKDAMGRTTMTHGANQDITDRRRTERELRESRRMLDEAMDLANVVSWEFDIPAGQFVFNDRFYTLYRTTAEQEGGYRMDPERYIREFVYPDDRGAVTAALLDRQESARPGQEYQMEHRIVRRDRDIRTIVVRVGAYADAAGHLTGIHGVNQDITGQKQAETALRESEEKFRSLVETSPDMVWEIDLQGRFRYISPMIRTIMGYDPEEITGTPITDLIQEQKQTEVRQELARHIASGRPFNIIEVPARHRDGRGMVIEIRSQKVFGPDGKLAGMRGVALDITERKQAEEALRQATRKLQLLSGITRHDISNQLLTLDGFVAMLRKKVTDPGLDPFFGRIREASSQISSMIAFTKEYEKIGVEAPVWQDVRVVVDQAVTGILPAQIHFVNRIPDGTMVFADSLIVKVFFNLLDNSIRHGERVSEVQVSSRVSGPDLVLVWEDNGIGIPPGEKEEVFGRGVGKHTGLGMFLAREILSLTGISITENGVPGQGARFEMVVPAGAFRLSSEQKP